MYPRSENKDNARSAGRYLNAQGQHAPPNGHIGHIGHTPYPPQEPPMQYQARQPYSPVHNSKPDEQQYASYAPQPQHNGFFSPPAYTNAQMQPDPPRFHHPQFMPVDPYQQTGNASPPQQRMTSSYSGGFNQNLSPQATPQAPGGVNGVEFVRLEGTQMQHVQPQHQRDQSSFYGVAGHQQQQQQQQQQYQPQQHQYQQQPHQQQQQQQPQLGGIQSAVPLMFSGIQQLGNAGNGGFNAALGAQLFQSLAPGAVGYTNQLFGQGQDSVRSFMRMPKIYFAVNHKYVLKKLYLILMPFTNRIWARQRGVDPAQFEGAANDGVMYLPPREDVNAPDLYIPVMAFITYVLMVGFVFGVRNKFEAEVLAKYFSKGLGLLSLEVLVIKLGLYLINARPTPWLDVIAYRGYKFVGVVLTMVTGFVVPQLYLPVLLYSASAMVIFLMRSHRRIILPRDADVQQGQDLARRNAFLLFLSVLQYPIYWVLVLDVRN